MLNGRVDRGVLICKSGIGMSIAANRFPGIRAALVTDEASARLSRAHNDANVIVLSGNELTHAQAIHLLEVWLHTEFDGGRHARRVNKMDNPPLLMTPKRSSILAVADPE